VLFAGIDGLLLYMSQMEPFVMILHNNINVNGGNGTFDDDPKGTLEWTHMDPVQHDQNQCHKWNPSSITVKYVGY
jgi:hypothetical protein